MKCKEQGKGGTEFAETTKHAGVLVTSQTTELMGFFNFLDPKITAFY